MGAGEAVAAEMVSASGPVEEAPAVGTLLPLPALLLPEAPTIKLPPPGLPLAAPPVPAPAPPPPPPPAAGFPLGGILLAEGINSTPQCRPRQTSMATV